MGKIINKPTHNISIGKPKEKRPFTRLSVRGGKILTKKGGSIWTRALVDKIINLGDP